MSANGFAILYADRGSWWTTAGTSASTPIVGSIISLINQQRKKAGKSTVGFINPFIYAHPELFNDITAGTNPACNLPGFSAVPGWDPVTGLGTPNYAKLLAAYMK